MSNGIQVYFSSKVGVFLHHLLNSNAVLVSSDDAARVMGVARRSVSSMLAYGVRSGYLEMTWEADGQRYKLAPDAIVTKGTGSWYEVYVPLPEGYEGDFDFEFLKVRRSWVNAKGLPPPSTTGVRSVFELAGSLR